MIPKRLFNPQLELELKGESETIENIAKNQFTNKLIKIKYMTIHPSMIYPSIKHKNRVYIGQTGRSINTRYSEHYR